MGNPQKAKGYRYEKEVEFAAKAVGLHAERAWGSDGRALGFGPDVDLVVEGFTFQAKRRKKLSKWWMGDYDVLVTREDRGKSYCVLELDLLLKILKGDKEMLDVQVSFEDGRKYSAGSLNLSSPGLILLRGRQGIGKTTLRAGLAIAAGDSQATMPEGAVVTITSDGEKPIQISNKHRHSGSLPIPIITATTIWQLIDSGAKTSSTRGKFRAKALLSLIRVTEATAKDVLSQILPEGSKLTDRIMESREIISLGERWSTSYDDFLGRVARCVQGFARELEDTARQKQEEFDFWKRKILESGFVDTLTVTAINNAKEHLLSETKTWFKKDDPVAFIKEQIEGNSRYIARNSIVLEEKKKAFARIQDVVESVDVYTKKDLEEAKVEVHALKDEVLRIENQLAHKKAELESCKRRGKDILAYLAKVEEREQNVGLDKEIEQEEALLKAAIGQRDSLESDILPKVEAYLRIESSYEQLTKARKERDIAKGDALSTRELVRDNVFQVDIKKALGINGVRVGRTDVEVFFNKEWRQLENMSEGERVKCVFDILTRVTEDKVVFIDRAIFTSLTPENRRILIDELISREMVGITEMPTDDDELRVQQFTKGEDYNAST